MIGIYSSNRAMGRAGVALAALIVGGAGTALAQGAPAAQTGTAIGLDTIEVQGERASGPVNGYVARRSDTATKTDTPLMETPQSVTVVTRDQMDDQGAQNVSQALRYTAGVLGETRLSMGRYDSVFIRGFGGSGGARGGLGTAAEGGGGGGAAAASSIGFGGSGGAGMSLAMSSELGGGDVSAAAMTMGSGGFAAATATGGSGLASGLVGGVVS